jgi:hypothetical protein
VTGKVRLGSQCGGSQPRPLAVPWHPTAPPVRFITHPGLHRRAGGDLLAGEGACADGLHFGC